MNAYINKGICLLILLTACLMLTVGCQPKKATTVQLPAAQETTTAQGEKAHDNGKMRTIIDQNGRTVKIPTDIKRVVITTVFPIPSVFFMVDGSSAKLVGIPPASKGAAEVSMFSTLSPEISQAATGFVKGTDVNIEELLKLNPDLIIYRGENTPELALLEKTGIPVVAFKTATLADGNALENVYAWMKLLGQILNKESKAEEFISHANQELGMIQSRIWNIPENKKPRALMLFRHSEKEITVAGTGHFGHFWLKTTGAINVAEEVKNTASVSMEQIYQWNPDIIYISSFTETLAEDLLQNKVNGQDWSNIQAVKSGKVYKDPLGIYRWYPPSTDAPLMLKWLAQKNHPDLFTDVSMEQSIKEYYKKFYKYELSDEQVRKILNPPREAAKGT